jgi:hypothetical protein
VGTNGTTTHNKTTKANNDDLSWYTVCDALQPTQESHVNFEHAISGDAAGCPGVPSIKARTPTVEDGEREVRVVVTHNQCRMTVRCFGRNIVAVWGQINSFGQTFGVVELSGEVIRHYQPANTKLHKALCTLYL